MAPDALAAMVARHEGFARVVQLRPVPTAVPYLCPAGYWTKGYGHVCAKDDPPITEPEARVLLQADLGIAAGAVRRLISWPLNANQAAALVSWTFNLGSARLRASTLRQVINRGELDAAPAQMRRWVFGGGKVLPGLVIRRTEEAELFECAP